MTECEFDAARSSKSIRSIEFPPNRNGGAVALRRTLLPLSVFSKSPVRRMFCLTKRHLLRPSAQSSLY